LIVDGGHGSLPIMKSSASLCFFDSLAPVTAFHIP
jgi:hypothetical protein